MAEKNRNTLTNQNTSLDNDKDSLFPDNNNKEITALRLRTWLDSLLDQVLDIIDSYFNKIDEPRGVAQDIAYISQNGNDGTAIVGAESLPFLTFPAALAAIPTGGTIKFLGGSYTGDLIIDKTAYIDMRGINLNGVVTVNATNITISAWGSVANSASFGIRRTGASNYTGLKVYGGVWNAVQVLELIANLNFDFYDCVFNASSTFNGSVVETGSFYNCKFNNSDGYGVVTLDNKFYNCSVKSATDRAVIVSNGGLPHFIECDIEGDRGIFTSTGSQQTGFVMRGGTVKGLGSFAIQLQDKCSNVDIQNVRKISGATNAVEYVQADRLAGQNIIQNSKLYAGSGNIVNEGVYDGTDAGSLELIGCTYNKALGALTKVNESNGTTIVGLQEV